MQAIAFLDQTNHVDQLFYQQSQWLFNDLTAFTNAPVAAPGSALASYVLPNGVQAVVYLDNNANVDQLFFQQNKWQFNDLTPFANAPAAMTGSSLATYVLPNGVQAIAFIDSSHHVDQLFYQSGAWQYNDLSATVSAPPVFTGGSLNPSAPGKEYIYFGGKLLAVENSSH